MTSPLSSSPSDVVARRPDLDAIERDYREERAGIAEVGILLAYVGVLEKHVTLTGLKDWAAAPLDHAESTACSGLVSDLVGIGRRMVEEGDERGPMLRAAASTITRLEKERAVLRQRMTELGAVEYWWSTELTKEERDLLPAIAARAEHAEAALSTANEAHRIAEFIIDMGARLASNVRGNEEWVGYFREGLEAYKKARGEEFGVGPHLTVAGIRSWLSSQEGEKSGECLHNGRCNRPPYPTCLCGARMDTPTTHPHVIACPCATDIPSTERPCERCGAEVVMTTLGFMGCEGCRFPSKHCQC